MPVSSLRVFSASWPGKVEPWRARFIRDLHLDLSGEFDTDVIAPAIHAEDPIEEQDQRLRVRRFRYLSGGKAPRQGGMGFLTALSWLLAGRKALRNWKHVSDHGVTLVHWGVPGAFLASSYCHSRKNPLVVWCHGSDVHRHGRRFPGSWLLRKGLSGAHKILAASEEMARELKQQHGIREVEVLPVGIDEAFRGPAPVSREGAGLRLLWVGERIESKGYGRTLRGIQKAIDRGAVLTLEAIGDGPMTGVNGYTPQLSGPKDPRGVREAMDRAGMLLLPSHGEGTPLVVQEAKARQLPVAATEVGGIPDLYQGDQGWFPLTPDCDEVVESEICDLLVRLSQNPQVIEEKRRQLREPAVPVLFRRDSSRRLAEILQEVCS